MAFEISSQVRPDYFFIKAIGSISNIEEYKVMMEIYISLIIESGYTSIILDEKNLAFPEDEKFGIEVVDFQTKNAPFEFRKFKLANIANQAFLPFFKIWETASQIKGFHSFKYFNDLDSAYHWLKNES